MRGALVAVVLGLSLLGTRSVPAAPFSTAFDDLKADLESRRDKDFDGVLDAAQKKQRKAVLKCLALIEKPSATALNDLKTFGAVAKALAKGYPEERALGFDSTLWFSLLPVFNGVDGPFGGDLYDLRTAVGRLVPNAASRKASRFLALADAARNQFAEMEDFPAIAKHHLKAWKSVLKGLPVALAGEQLPAPSVAFTADGVDVAATDVSWIYHSVSQRITLVAPGTDPLTGDPHVLVLDVQLSPPGTDLGISNGTYSRTTDANGQEDFFVVEGTGSSTAFDLAGHRFEGTFDITVSGPADFAITGTFRATWGLEILED